MKTKPLNEKVIGCKHCLGEWIKVKNVRKSLRDFSIEFERKREIGYAKWEIVEMLEKHFGKPLLEGGDD